MKPTNTPENAAKCICPGCLVYSDCARGKEEKLFCGRIKTDCPMDNKQACICGSCPVYAENSLTGGYFCITGL